MNKLLEITRRIGILFFKHFLMLLGIAFLFAILYTPPQPITPTYTQDPTLLGVLQSVGASTTNLNISYKVLPNSNQRGEYYDGTIYIAPGLDADQQNRTVSHELLHHIWYKALTQDKITELSSKLIVMYSNDIGMKQRTNVYADKNTLIPTELFSIYCTESSDSFIEPIVNDCNTYINRKSLVFLR